MAALRVVAQGVAQVEDRQPARRDGPVERQARRQRLVEAPPEGDGGVVPDGVLHRHRGGDAGLHQRGHHATPHVLLVAAPGLAGAQDDQLDALATQVDGELIGGHRRRVARTVDEHDRALAHGRAEAGAQPGRTEHAVTSKMEDVGAFAAQQLVAQRLGGRRLQEVQRDPRQALQRPLHIAPLLGQVQRFVAIRLGAGQRHQQAAVSRRRVEVPRDGERLVAHDRDTRVERQEAGAVLLPGAALHVHILPRHGRQRGRQPQPDPQPLVRLQPVQAADEEVARLIREQQIGQRLPQPDHAVEIQLPPLHLPQVPPQVGGHGPRLRLALARGRGKHLDREAVDPKLVLLHVVGYKHKLAILLDRHPAPPTTNFHHRDTEITEILFCSSPCPP